MGAASFPGLVVDSFRPTFPVCLRRIRTCMERIFWEACGEEWKYSKLSSKFKIQLFVRGSCWNVCFFFWEMKGISRDTDVVNHNPFQLFTTLNSHQPDILLVPRVSLCATKIQCFFQAPPDGFFGWASSYQIVRKKVCESKW